MFDYSNGRDAEISSSQRRALFLIAVVAPFLGAASFVYLVFSHPRGSGPQTVWKTVVTWVLFGAPIAVAVGGAMCAFAATRRPGMRVLGAGIGVIFGFVGLFALLLLVLRFVGRG